MNVEPISDEMIRPKAQSGLARHFANQPYGRPWVAPDGLDAIEETEGVDSDEEMIDAR